METTPCQLSCCQLFCENCGIGFSPDFPSTKHYKMCLSCDVKMSNTPAETFKSAKTHVFHATPTLNENGTLLFPQSHAEQDLFFSRYKSAILKRKTPSPVYERDYTFENGKVVYKKPLLEYALHEQPATSFVGFILMCHIPWVDNKNKLNMRTFTISVPQDLELMFRHFHMYVMNQYKDDFIQLPILRPEQTHMYFDDIMIAKWILLRIFQSILKCDIKHQAQDLGDKLRQKMLSINPKKLLCHTFIVKHEFFAQRLFDRYPTKEILVLRIEGPFGAEADW